MPESQETHQHECPDCGETFDCNENCLIDMFGDIVQKKELCDDCDSNVEFEDDDDDDLDDLYDDSVD